MTIEDINKAYRRTIGALDEKGLKEAFDQLQGLIAGLRDYSFQAQLDELQTNYQRLLRYRLEGVKDPMEEQIYRGLLTAAYQLAEAVREKALTAISSQAYYRMRREGMEETPLTYVAIHKQLTAASLLGAPGRQKRDVLTAKLFNQVWATGALREEEADALRAILADTDISYVAKCQIVSALLLSLQGRWEERKVLLLFDAAANESEEVRIRALVCLLLILYIYRRRTAVYPQISNRLHSLAEECPGFTRILRTITLRFILARETEKITRRMRDELLPEMMKLDPNLSRKINLKDLTPEQLGEEMNPEWQEKLADSSLGKKMMEFSELQLEGADVLHSSFVHLKHFPFFREVGNWLLPFTADYSGLQGEALPEREKEAFETMALASFICNSDKYSLYFTLMQMPEDARRMMVEQFHSQSVDLIQQNKEELLNRIGQTDLIVGQYVQDLYRFYKLYPAHLDFDDIFTYPLDFHNLSILQPYLADEETLAGIAEYYLHKNYFHDAHTVFQRLALLHPEQPELLQKSGYCKQMEGDIRGALESYLRADLLRADSPWVIRHIAGCYRTLKQPQEALKYYRRYEALAPDNLSVQASIGHCYLELKDYDAALKYFFKVDYLDAESRRAWRPIAWCSFLTGKYDQACAYYRKILANGPTMQDYLNAGHTAWALQQLKEALAYYRQAVQCEGGDFVKFREQFTRDLPDLEAAGIEAEEVPLLLDQLKYDLEGRI